MGRSKTKVCHVLSFVSYSLFFEAVAEYLDKEKYEISFIFLGEDESPLQKKLCGLGIDARYIRYSSRKDLPRAILNLRKVYAEMRPDIVHTHLVDASLAGLIAAKFSGIRHRVHTRHHSTECHVYYPHAVYYDKLINRISKRIVATTEIVRETLEKMENVEPSKIDVMNLAYDLKNFEGTVSGERVLRDKYSLNGHYPIIGVISRFVEWKGVQYIIPAFARIVKDYPNAKLVLANARGNHTEVLDRLLSEYLLPGQFVKIDFEAEIFDLYKTFDIFVHVPVRGDAEAFGQIYIEALYREVPAVVTLSGVANEFIEDGQNALVVPYENSDGIFEAITKLLSNESLRASISRQGRADVENRFGADILAENLDEFYSRLLEE